MASPYIHSHRHTYTPEGVWVLAVSHHRVLYRLSELSAVARLERPPCSSREQGTVRWQGRLNLTLKSWTEAAAATPIHLSPFNQSSQGKAQQPSSAPMPVPFEGLTKIRNSIK